MLLFETNKSHLIIIQNLSEPIDLKLENEFVNSNLKFEIKMISSNTTYLSGNQYLKGDYRPNNKFYYFTILIIQNLFHPYLYYIKKLLL